MIHFPTLLQRHHIPYITTGPNVARGNLNIHCPFCGPQDPSYHLGIRISDGAWGCWRDPLHRGRKPHRLLRQLLQWSAARIDAEVGVDRTQAVRWVSPSPPHHAQARPTMPAQFRLITGDRSTTAHWLYLRSRGYSNQEVALLVERYDLRAAVSGEWANRVIIPVYDEEGRLLTWVGRAIGKSSFARYKALGKAQAIATTDTLWRGKESAYARFLVLVEGVFDAMKLDLHGGEWGLSATCVFGASLTTKQERILRRMCEGVDVVVVAFDRENLVGTLSVAKRLVGLKVLPMSMEQKDPGSMSGRDVRAWVEELSAKV